MCHGIVLFGHAWHVSCEVRSFDLAVRNASIRPTAGLMDATNERDTTREGWSALLGSQLRGARRSFRSTTGLRAEETKTVRLRRGRSGVTPEVHKHWPVAPRLNATARWRTHRQRATIRVISSDCSCGLNFLTSSTTEATSAAEDCSQCRRRDAIRRCSPNSSPQSLNASVMPSV